jgi:hypothetical protein
MKMASEIPDRFVLFDGSTLIADGQLALVATAACAYRAAKPDATLVVLDLETGSAVDLDLRGNPQEVVSRLTPPEAPSENTGAVRGRPRLGVVAREVTLLPRHWEWLAGQRGGASAALRRLVDEARQRTAEADNHRRRLEAAYRTLTTLAGDLPNYESAIRALFASDSEAFQAATALWSSDLQRVCMWVWPIKVDIEGTSK